MDHARHIIAATRGLPGETTPPEPWYMRDPWEALDPWTATDDKELPGMPMTIGPGNLTDSPASGIDLNSGAMMASATRSLAESLHWDVPEETDHPQVQIKVGEAVVSVDREMAELVFLLNRSHIFTSTSCTGSQEVCAYVMIAGLDSIVRFLQFWNTYLCPLGHAVPTLDLDGRNSAWRTEISTEFPFPRPIPVDERGLSYTGNWRECCDDMTRLRPVVIRALRFHLRVSDGDTKPQKK